MKIFCLAERDHLLKVRPHGFRFRDRRGDALTLDECRHQIAQQRAAMTGVPSELPTCIAMSHDVFLFLYSRAPAGAMRLPRSSTRSEEHTSELQSRLHLVC